VVAVIKVTCFFSSKLEREKLAFGKRALEEDSPGNITDFLVGWVTAVLKHAELELQRI
jgi:hypothetical protein